jgi:hypothetical protein
MAPLPLKRLPICAPPRPLSILRPDAAPARAPAAATALSASAPAFQQGAAPAPAPAAQAWPTPHSRAASAPGGAMQPGLPARTQRGSNAAEAAQAHAGGRPSTAPGGAGASVQRAFAGAPGQADDDPRGAGPEPGLQRGTAQLTLSRPRRILKIEAPPAEPPRERRCRGGPAARGRGRPERRR